MQKNLNYKKEASQRQLEKMKKAAAAEKKEEKKLFPILDAMGIEHVDVGGRSDA